MQGCAAEPSHDGVEAGAATAVVSVVLVVAVVPPDAVPQATASGSSRPSARIRFIVLAFISRVLASRISEIRARSWVGRSLGIGANR
jgi:hypothetical protein